MDNIELEFTDDAVRAVAKKAKELKTGARGLRAIVEDCMQDVMFDSPSQNIEKIVITEKVINGEEKPEVIHKVKPEAV